MKILFITNVFPYPPHSGPRLKTYNIISRISQKHTTYLISAIDPNDNINDKEINEMYKYCDYIHLYTKSNQRSKLIKLLSHLSFATPSFVKEYNNKNILNQAKEIILREKIDIVHVDSLCMSFINNDTIKNVPIIISPNDSLTLSFLNEILYMPKRKWRKKIYRIVALPSVFFYERKIYKKYNTCHFVAELDARAVKIISPNASIMSIPIGVDSLYFKPENTDDTPPTLVYTGDMGGGGADYGIWFIDNVFPKITKIFPDCKLYIVGKNPTKELASKGTNNDNIIVTGEVKDIRKYISLASIVISPVLKKCGILNKILEAMAMQKPVVGTNISFTGIKHFVNLKHGIGVDTCEDFADNIIYLLHNKKIRDDIGYSARELVIHKYSWEKTAESFFNLYSCCLNDNDIR